MSNVAPHLPVSDRLQEEAQALSEERTRADVSVLVYMLCLLAVE